MSATTVLIGNTTADIEIRYTQAGKAVGNVTIAVADRVKEGDKWVDGKTWFARCTLWGDLAENAAASITKGTRVIAQGRLEQRDWEDKDGAKRTSVEVTLDEIGPSVKYATAVVTRAQSSRDVVVPAQAEEPWVASAPGSSVAWNAPGSYSDETPF